MAISGYQVVDAPRNRRRVRPPRHTFQLRTRPWQIAPFMIAPVLPGETLQNLNIQSRVVTDPIKNKLTGWWNEYYFFYVKHRDLAGRDDFVDMVLEPDKDLSAYDSATKIEHHHVNGTDLAIDWVDLCLTCITEAYFRWEGETVSTASVGNLPAAQCQHDGFWDSAINSDDFVDPASFDTDLADVGSEGGAKVLTSEIDAAMRQYHLMRAAELTEMTYEDFLRTYGVSVPKAEELHMPELLRYLKDWTYPTNAVDPTDGSVASACSWSTAGRADKKRFFKEPGFIFGVTVCRPKVFFENITSNGVMLLKDAVSWLPAVLSDDPFTSVRKVTAGDPPLDANTDDYWVDVKDLFMHGDQFVNFALTEADANIVALPEASGQKRYASGTDADGLFASASPANQIRQDGVVQLAISSELRDTTPQHQGT